MALEGDRKRIDSDNTRQLCRSRILSPNKEFNVILYVNLTRENRKASLL